LRIGPRLGENAFRTLMGVQERLDGGSEFEIVLTCGVEEGFSLGGGAFEGVKEERFFRHSSFPNPAIDTAAIAAAGQCDRRVAPAPRDFRKFVRAVFFPRFLGATRLVRRPSGDPRFVAKGQAPRRSRLRTALRSDAVRQSGL